uniref:Uncharacterized protein n=1 Tax=Chromera velia CCMP2878 TaxID=1169474 RepID=A0A0G4I1X4_9ALVE|eukprot:Cvel_10258.t1-p1 / transcript=Cvel_10258.t1 / gene=Cvel_10258 / organism=Chromera_velia_CCMP2878 / gene_product=hypothetical protein / transcript_product=hypothetical protein / location=Cvel_scaffold615:16563-24104(+) / protein_length=1885 / sequence_SO=supercontig / SO=protein_coding / is_pseudo=false
MACIILLTRDVLALAGKPLQFRWRLLRIFLLGPCAGRVVRTWWACARRKASPGRRARADAEEAPRVATLAMHVLFSQGLQKSGSTPHRAVRHMIQTGQLPLSIYIHLLRLKRFARTLAVRIERIRRGGQILTVPNLKHFPLTNSVFRPYKCLMWTRAIAADVDALPALDEGLQRLDIESPEGNVDAVSLYLTRSTILMGHEKARRIRAKKTPPELKWPGLGLPFRDVAASTDEVTEVTLEVDGALRGGEENEDEEEENGEVGGPVEQTFYCLIVQAETEMLADDGTERGGDTRPLGAEGDVTALRRRFRKEGGMLALQLVLYFPVREDAEEVLRTLTEELSGLYGPSPDPPPVVNSPEFERAANAFWDRWLAFVPVESLALSFKEKKKEVADPSDNTTEGASRPGVASSSRNAPSETQDGAASSLAIPSSAANPAGGAVGQAGVFGGKAAPSAVVRVEQAVPQVQVERFFAAIQVSDTSVKENDPLPPSIASAEGEEFVHDKHSRTAESLPWLLVTNVGLLLDYSEGEWKEGDEVDLREWKGDGVLFPEMTFIPQGSTRKALVSAPELDDTEVLVDQGDLEKGGASETIAFRGRRAGERPVCLRLRIHFLDAEEAQELYNSVYAALGSLLQGESESRLDGSVEEDVLSLFGSRWREAFESARLEADAVEEELGSEGGGGALLSLPPGTEDGFTEIMEELSEGAGEVDKEVPAEPLTEEQPQEAPGRSPRAPTALPPAPAESQRRESGQVSPGRRITPLVTLSKLIASSPDEESVLPRQTEGETERNPRVYSTPGMVRHGPSAFSEGGDPEECLEEAAQFAEHTQADAAGGEVAIVVDQSERGSVGASALWHSVRDAQSSVGALDGGAKWAGVVDEETAPTRIVASLTALVGISKVTSFLFGEGQRRDVHNRVALPDFWAQGWRRQRTAGGRAVSHTGPLFFRVILTNKHLLLLPRGRLEMSNAPENESELRLAAITETLPSGLRILFGNEEPLGEDDEMMTDMMYEGDGFSQQLNGRDVEGSEGGVDVGRWMGADQIPSSEAPPGGGGGHGGMRSGSLEEEEYDAAGASEFQGSVFGRVSLKKLIDSSAIVIPLRHAVDVTPVWSAAPLVLGKKGAGKGKGKKGEDEEEEDEEDEEAEEGFDASAMAEEWRHEGDGRGGGVRSDRYKTDASPTGSPSRHVWEDEKMKKSKDTESFSKVAEKKGNNSKKPLRSTSTKEALLPRTEDLDDTDEWERRVDGAGGAQHIEGLHFVFSLPTASMTGLGGDFSVTIHSEFDLKTLRQIRRGQKQGGGLPTVSGPFGDPLDLQSERGGMGIELEHPDLLKEREDEVQERLTTQEQEVRALRMLRCSEHLVGKRADRHLWRLAYGGMGRVASPFYGGWNFFIKSLMRDHVVGTCLHADTHRARLHRVILLMTWWSGCALFAFVLFCHVLAGEDYEESGYSGMTRKSMMFRIRVAASLAPFHVIGISIGRSVLIPIFVSLIACVPPAILEVLCFRKETPYVHRLEYLRRTSKEKVNNFVLTPQNRAAAAAAAAADLAARSTKEVQVGIDTEDSGVKAQRMVLVPVKLLGPDFVSRWLQRTRFQSRIGVGVGVFYVVCCLALLVIFATTEIEALRVTNLNVTEFLAMMTALLGFQLFGVMPLFWLLLFGLPLYFAGATAVPKKDTDSEENKAKAAANDIPDLPALQRRSSPFWRWMTEVFAPGAGRCLWSLEIPEDEDETPFCANKNLSTDAVEGRLLFTASGTRYWPGMGVEGRQQLRWAWEGKINEQWVLGGAWRESRSSRVLDASFREFEEELDWDSEIFDFLSNRLTALPKRSKKKKAFDKTKATPLTALHGSSKKSKGADSNKFAQGASTKGTNWKKKKVQIEGSGREEQPPRAPTKWVD